MTRFTLAALSLALLFLGVPAAAQQSNSAAATATWGGVNAPVGPITVSYIATAIPYVVQGGPNVPYVLVNAPAGVTTPGIPTASGFVDLDLSGGFSYVLNGFSGTGVLDAFARTNSLGYSIWQVPINGPAYLGGMQTIVASPTSPSGLAFSAASSVTLQLGVTWSTPASNLTWSEFNLSFGSIVFYDQTYTSVVAYDDGALELGVNTAGVVTAPLCGSQAPRVAGLLADLSGGTFGVSTGRIDFVELPTGLTVTYQTMHQWSGSGCSGGFYVANTGNTFSIHYEYLTGRWTLNYPFGAQTLASATIGIRPSASVAGSNLAAGITNLAPYSSCGSSIVGPGAPFSSIMANGAITPSGCSLTFTPTVFNGPGGIARAYRLH